MIAQVVGRVAAVTELSALVECGPVTLEVLIPAASRGELESAIGVEVALRTVFYVEGSPTGGNLTPRLLGFVRPSDREFFHLFTKVRGVSMRRALRAMAVPTNELAAAIERGDEKYLSSLPEIGKKTAAQIVTELRGQMAGLAAEAAAGPSPAAELTEAQRLAVEILASWGDRRPDAQRWVLAAVQADGKLATPEEIVRAAYRAKHGG